MSIRERLSGIWLISMTLLSLFALTVFYVAQMWMDILVIRMAYLALAALQVTTLVIYLWGPEKLSFRPLKILYRVMSFSSVFVIPAFVFIFSGLLSQYHAVIPDRIDASAMAAEELLPGEHTRVYDTGSVYVIFPEYTQVDHVSGKRPSQADGTITWCSGAAFQHAVRLGFTHENIDGDHADSGVFHESPYNKDSFAAFVFADGKYAFEFDRPSEAIRAAAEAGGSGFMQFGLIRDGKTVMTVDRLRVRCYRVLAELNGNLCVIDSVRMTHFEDFMEELLRLGVTNAVYMDMGAGWNYSWLRDAAGRVVTLFGLPVPWSHNWVVFRTAGT